MEIINKVFNEDCLIGMQRIADKSIDMILCDLPYGTTACKWDVIIPFDKLWKQYERIIKDNGAIILTASQPFTSALVMSNPKLFKYEIIWDKVSTSSGIDAKIKPLRSHENVLVFYKQKATYNPIMSEGIKWHRGGRKTTGNFLTNGGAPLGLNKSDENNLKYPKTILSISNANKLSIVHPTQKPVALFEYLIKTYTNEGDLVLDNCAGSGTTAIACINTNRNYMLIEKEEKYYEIIKERIKRHAPQLKLIA